MRALGFVALLAVVTSAVLGGQAAAPPLGQTVIDWQSAGEQAKTFTLYANGTMAKGTPDSCPTTEGQKTYRWVWTEKGLVIKFYSGRFILSPVPGAIGRFTGQSVPATTAGVSKKADVTVRQTDGAGILLWLQPLTDGVQSSAIERQAAAEAHNAVVVRLRPLGAKQDAAAGKANSTAASLSSLRRAEAVAGDRVRARAEALRVARSREWKARKWVSRTVAPAYSWATFANALADWTGWQGREANAEADLDRARADLAKAADRRVRAQADLRQAESEYVIARSDYESAYWLAWRPEYLKRKVALKALAARVASDAAERAARAAAGQPPPAAAP